MEQRPFVYWIETLHWAMPPPYLPHALQGEFDAHPGNHDLSDLNPGGVQLLDLCASHSLFALFPYEAT